MFIVSITYKVDLTQVDALIPEHVEFLDKYYDSGNFIASGRKVPRVGGVILAKADSKQALLTILEQDPFHREGIADYDVIEFVPNKKVDEFCFD